MPAPRTVQFFCQINSCSVSSLIGIHPEETTGAPRPKSRVTTTSQSKFPHCHPRHSRRSCPRSAPRRSYELQLHFASPGSGSCCALCLECPLHLAYLVNVHTSIHTGPMPPVEGICSDLLEGSDLLFLWRDSSNTTKNSGAQ